MRLLLAAAVALACSLAVFALSRDSGRAESKRATEAWSALESSPLERTEVGAARIGDRIYVVGGFISEGGTTARMAVYDISSDRWRQGAPLPIAVNHPGFASLGGRLYLLGGFLGGGGESDRLYRYSPEGERWRRLPSAPTARGALGLVGIGRRLYAVGGAASGDDTLQTLEIYDLTRRRWTTGPEMPTGRNHVAATYFKRGVVVTGGRPGPDHGNLATVEHYRPQDRSWTEFPTLETARSGHAAVALGRAPFGGRIVVFGGEELDGGTTIEQVELFDPRDGGWRPLPSMLTPRHGLGGVAGDGRVYALEGGPQPGLAYSGALEYLDVR